MNHSIEALKWVLNDMNYCAPELAAEKMQIWHRKISATIAELSSLPELSAAGAGVSQVPYAYVHLENGSIWIRRGMSEESYAAVMKPSWHPLWLDPPAPQEAEAVPSSDLGHILDAEHSERVLGFPVKLCWCCGGPAEVDMSCTCARCADQLCWGYNILVPVVAWNKRAI